MLPGETYETVLDHFGQLLDALVKEHPKMEVIIHPPLLTDVALETDADSAAVQRMIAILEDMQLDASPIGVPFCSDASKFGAIGIPSMILGPGSIDQAHAADEFIEYDQVLIAADIYRRFMIEFE